MKEQIPLPNLIAGLSLVSFTAGISQLALPNASYLWIVGGLLGLISAVGLDVVRRQRENTKTLQPQKVDAAASR